MGLTTESIRGALSRIAPRMPALAVELNAADGRLGDGDTGVMLRRVFDKLNEAAGGAPEDLGAAFRALAQASSGATGSSLGTLFTFALMTSGKGTAGKTEVDWREFGAVLQSVAEVMLTRGGAKLGDKTVVDAITAVARELSQLKDGEDAGAAALRAGRATLDEFRDKPCKMGRARMFAEKSVGMDDPGMLAFVRLLEAVTSPAA
jgi:dihydroxyacetone kinase